MAAIHKVRKQETPFRNLEYGDIFTDNGMLWIRVDPFKLRTHNYNNAFGINTGNWGSFQLYDEVYKLEPGELIEITKG